jgi:hypothetical protein
MESSIEYNKIGFKIATNKHFPSLKVQAKFKSLAKKISIRFVFFICAWNAKFCLNQCPRLRNYFMCVVFGASIESDIKIRIGATNKFNSSDKKKLSCVHSSVSRFTIYTDPRNKDHLADLQS